MERARPTYVGRRTTRTRTTTTRAGSRPRRPSVRGRNGRIAGALIGLALGACATTEPDDDEPVVLSPRIAVSAVNGPIRLSTLDGTNEKIVVAGHVNVPT